MKKPNKITKKMEIHKKYVSPQFKYDHYKTNNSLLFIGLSKYNNKHSTIEI